MSPISYAMQNGQTGSYQYWDESYGGPGATGSPTTSLSALSGGLGDLTDGVIATQNWPSAEQPAGPGPYVGWFDIDPMITFTFAAPVSFESVTFHLDDSNGFGGVNPPSSITAGGVNQVVPDPANGAPFSVTIMLNGLTTDTLSTQLFRSTNSWVFLSEVEFETTTPVPVPAALPLALAAFGALGALGARRRA